MSADSRPSELSQQQETELTMADFDLKLNGKSRATVKLHPPEPWTPVRLRQSRRQSVLERIIAACNVGRHGQNPKKVQNRGQKLKKETSAPIGPADAQNEVLIETEVAEEEDSCTELNVKIEITEHLPHGGMSIGSSTHAEHLTAAGSVLIKKEADEEDSSAEHVEVKVFEHFVRGGSKSPNHAEYLPQPDGLLDRDPLDVEVDYRIPEASEKPAIKPYRPTKWTANAVAQAIELLSQPIEDRRKSKLRRGRRKRLVYKQTPEQKARSLETTRRRNKRIRENETEEQRQERLERRREYRQSRQARIRLQGALSLHRQWVKETEEKKLMRAERAKMYRFKKMAMLTEEQRREERAARNERARVRHHAKKERLQMLATD